MPLTDDQIRLLSRATEDWTGLYEAVWELRTGQPRLADTELLRRAKNALSELVRRNLVYICRLQSRPATEEEATRYAADAGFSSESRRWQTPVETPVAPDTVDAVLQDDRSYGPEGEERGGHYCFAATANGQAAYRQLQWDSTGQKLVDPG